jgi:hypothetical protein
MGAPASIKADDGIAKGGNAAHPSIVVIFKNRYIILKKPETFQDLLAFVSNSFGSNRPISMHSYSKHLQPCRGRGAVARLLLPCGEAWRSHLFRVNKWNFPPYSLHRLVRVYSELTMSQLPADTFHVDVWRLA